LQAAADEENEDLQDLWSRLLAAAMDPSRRDAMRQAFIPAVKQMDPMDTVVLKAIYANGAQVWHANGRDVIASKLNCSTEEVLVSFNNLAELDCIGFIDNGGPPIQPLMKPFGTLLMKVVTG
jgi:Abortive infection alpha